MAYDFEFTNNLKPGSKVGKISTDYNLKTRIEIAEVADVTKTTIKLTTGETFFKKDGMRLGNPSYRAPRLISESRARKLMEKAGEDQSMTDLTVDVLQLFQGLPPQSPGNSRTELQKLATAHERAANLIRDYLNKGHRRSGAPVHDDEDREVMMLAAG